MGGTVNVAPKVSISTYWIHCRMRLHMWKSWGYFTIYGGSLVGLHTASTNQLPVLGCYFYSNICAALERKKLISWSHYAGKLVPWPHYAGTLIPWSHYAGKLVPWSHYAGTLIPWSHYAGTVPWFHYAGTVPWSHYAGTVPWFHYAGTLITALPQHLILVYQSAVDTFMVLCSIYCMYQPWRILLQYCPRSSRQKGRRTLVTATKIYCSICSVLSLLVPIMADGGNGRARALHFLKKASSEAIYGVLLGQDNICVYFMPTRVH